MKTKMYVLAALAVVGAVSTGYARQDAFLEYQEKRSEQAMANKGQTYAERTPAQADTKDEVVRTEQQTRDKMERALNRRQ